MTSATFRQSNRRAPVGDVIGLLTISALTVIHILNWGIYLSLLIKDLPSVMGPFRVLEDLCVNLLSHVLRQQ